MEIPAQKVLLNMAAAISRDLRAILRILQQAVKENEAELMKQ